MCHSFRGRLEAPVLYDFCLVIGQKAADSHFGSYQTVLLQGGRKKEPIIDLILLVFYMPSEFLQVTVFP